MSTRPDPIPPARPYLVTPPPTGAGLAGWRLGLLSLVCGLYLTGCGHLNNRTAGTEPREPRGGKVVVVPPYTGGGYYKDDGPGANPPEDLDAIPDAVPRREPMHPYANRIYKVKGKRYVPDLSGQPYKARGLASWYGRKFHGRATSSGEPYDMYAMSAAHRTLPIPSYARVTEFESGITDTTPAWVLDSVRVTPDGTDEVRRIRLRVPESALYFTQGQNVGVLVPGPHPFGNKYHHRYYTIADTRGAQDGAELELLVRRCFYLDEVSGERYPGIASNHLCDAKAGDGITLTGPYRSPFRIPADNTSNLLLLGTGTGVAPFRAFLRHIYEEQKGWKGKVRLFYGARNGTELLYMNDRNNDLAQYYDEKTFQAIRAVHDPLLGDESDALGQGLEDHAQEIWKLIQAPKTHVYLAGLKKIAAVFDGVMARQAGCEAAWQSAKDALLADKRWSELTYH